MKKLNVILLFAATVAIIGYSSCSKETPQVDPDPGPAPCEEFTWYEDADGDGKGNPDVSIVDCDQPTGYVLDNTDNMDALVEQKQVPILVKWTGENCGPCGSWGWSAWEDLYHDFVIGEGNALCWANYGDGFSSGQFRNEELNPTMDPFEDRFFSGGKPSFHANNTDHDQDDDAAKAEATTSLTETAEVSSNMNHKIEGDQLTVHAKVKFFSDMPGSYHVGAYLIEDGPTGYQAGHADGANTKHHLVMRGSLSASAWGEEIVENGAVTGDEFEKTFTATIPSGYNSDKFSYGLIVWRKLGPPGNPVFLYVNAFSTQ